MIAIILAWIKNLFLNEEKKVAAAYQESVKRAQALASQAETLGYRLGHLVQSQVDADVHFLNEEIVETKAQLAKVLQFLKDEYAIMEKTLQKLHSKI